MKIAIIGAGAVGGLIGGLLAYDKKDVIIIGRPDFVNSVKEKGLYLKLIDGKRITAAPYVTTDISEIRGVDAVILSVKSQDTVEVCESIKYYISPDTVIFSMQNGVRNAELIRSVLKDVKIVRTVVVFNSVYIKAGEISQGSNGPLIFENLPHVKEAVKYIETSLKIADICCKYEDNIEGVILSKLLLNLLNSIPAATNLDTVTMLVNPTISKIALNMMKEAENVVTSSGKVLKSLDGKSIRQMLMLLSLPIFLRKLILARMFKTDTVIPSTLQSILRGKRTEIDYLNGEIVSLAEATGQKAPVNKALLEAVKAVEQSSSRGSIKFYSPEQLSELVRSRTQAAK